MEPLNLKKAIFSIQTEQEFNDLSLEIFRYQVQHNSVYSDFVKALKVDPGSIHHFFEIPFMPIEFFKHHKISTLSKDADMVFTSSGTTGSQTSRHFVADQELYEQSFKTAFHQFYGDPSGFRIFALLPSYMERYGSSLIYMVDKLIQKSNFQESGFYLDHTDELIQYLNESEPKTLLIGVTFALLDLAEKQLVQNPNLMVMETGGMKGRRKEIVREELHKVLKSGFGVSQIHSEYGMTELLSQAYSRKDGIFQSPPWMRIMIRDANDPLSLIGHGQSGGINVIDLANLYSCSFIATQDLGKSYPDHSFEVLGRFDSSDIRGCNLMVL